MCGGMASVSARSGVTMLVSRCWRHLVRWAACGVTPGWVVHLGRACARHMVVVMLGGVARRVR